jgi:hypothetical protein
MQPLEIGAVVFVVILLGTFAGWIAGQRLKSHVQIEETKFLVSMAAGVVATVAAISLGLLLSNANTTYTTRSNDVTRMSAELIRLDHLLLRYGPETNAARATLRQYAAQKSADLFPVRRGDPVRVDNDSTYDLLFQVEANLLALDPENARNKWLVTQAMTLASDIGNTRWLLAQQEAQALSPAFLILLTFWLTLLFASFGLFAPRKAIAAVILVLCALAVSGAVEMIMDLQRPFEGFNRISPKPMRNAVKALNENTGRAFDENAGIEGDDQGVAAVRQ